MRVSPSLTGRERALLGTLLLTVAAFWFEPAGSYLAEPDEARYAEIPREMIAAGDYLTPRLNGIPYFEKPPLLYWANALSMRIFGQTPGAARLPNRLAGLGTTALLIVALSRLGSREAGLAAGLLFLGSPLGFGLSRLNLTDGVLTFFFTGTLLFGLRVLRRHEQGRSLRWSLFAMALMASGAFLTKGLVAIALPGAILVLWCVLTRRPFGILALLRFPAIPVFLVATLPWLLLMEREHPGFLNFFFVHEHFARFLTSGHKREGPPTYFVPVLVGAMLPVLAPFIAGLATLKRRSLRAPEHRETLFFLIWLVTVFLFFSLSRSKLIPYLLPALPAAAAFTAVRITGPPPAARVWKIQAAITALLVGVAALLPAVRVWVASYHLSPFALIGAVGLLTAAGLTARYARRSTAPLAAMLAGWAVFHASVALAWPRTLDAVEVHDFARLARGAMIHDGASVVTYRTYVQGLPWELKALVPAVDFRGELKPGLERLPPAQRRHFWTEESFWAAWQGERRIVAVVRGRDLDRFDRTRVEPLLLARGRSNFLVANYSPGDLPPPGALTSAALYTHGADVRRLLVSEVPPGIVSRARLENGDEKVVWAREERERGEDCFELISAGRFPIAVKLTRQGDFVYLEEEIEISALPEPVRLAISKSFPAERIESVMRETRRVPKTELVYEIILARQGSIREVHLNSRGHSLEAF